MLLIHCPYCDETAPSSSSPTPARPTSPAPPIPRSSPTRNGATSSSSARTRAATISSAGATSTAAPASSTRCARPSPTASSLTYKAGEPRPDIASLTGGTRMTSYRLPNRGRVDHGTPVRFTFDGKSYQGLAGDTLASALLANGVHLMGRSFKYHRPRGVVSAGSDEPNALMGTRRGPGRFEPNTRATIQELRDGLEADEPEPLALARLRPRRGQRPPRLALLRRLLLQDLHVAARLLGPRLRAGDPQRRRPRRLADRARRRPLRQPLRPHRRARRRRRPRRPRRRARRRPRRRARHARRRDRRARRQPPLRARRRHRRQARLGLARRRPSPSSPRCRTSR